MPAEEDKLEELSEDISGIRTDVSDILMILKGPRKSDQPGGLIYTVSKNTEFRRFFSKVLWVIFTANAGIIIWALTILIGGS